MERYIGGGPEGSQHWSSFPVDSGCTIVLAHGRVHQWGSVQTPLFRGFHGDFSCDRYDQLLTRSPAPEAGCGAESFRLLIKAWCFWPSAPIQKPFLGSFKVHFFRTKGAPIIPILQDITGNLGALCQELGTKTKHLSITPHKVSKIYLRSTVSQEAIKGNASFKQGTKPREGTMRDSTPEMSRGISWEGERRTQLGPIGRHQASLPGSWRLVGYLMCMNRLRGGLNNCQNVGIKLVINSYRTKQLRKTTIDSMENKLLQERQIILSILCDPAIQGICVIATI